MARTAHAAAPAPEPQEDISVFDDLLDAARQIKADFRDKHPKEDDQTFLKRLVVTLAEMSDDIWESMPQEAQEWFNGATDDMNRNADVNPPDGYVAEVAPPARRTRRGAAAAAPEAEPEEAAEPAEEPAEEPAATPTRRAGRAAAPAASPAAAPRAGRPGAQAPTLAPRRGANGNGAQAKQAQGAPATPRQPRGPSVVAEIRRAVIADPDITNDKIVATLNRKGLAAAVGTVQATRTFTRAVIDDARSMQRWAE